jgi:asparagine synthase (glutamine-hydrolysing)
MCGINGILRLSPSAPPIERDEVLRTRDAMERRGPDGAGFWESADGRVALGHRRLAIIDLSDAGAQPMASRDGRFRLTFNGALYNYRELRRELLGQGVQFHSEADTEVLLALYARDGVAMLRRLRGMYAFGLWDEPESTLLLARDPLGIKPLYYSRADGILRFASQVKALVAGGAIGGGVDLGAVAGFLTWGSVPEPLTLNPQIRALPAGHFLLVRDGRVEEPQRHYNESAAPPEAIGGRRIGDASVADALRDSVAAHLVGDVPVAVFLSAGLDSSLIAALARRVLPEPPTTLTVRFDALLGTATDDGPLAATVAAALGTNHREQVLSAADLRGLWPQALAAMDQPSIDGFNTFVVSRAAREAGFKVALSGLGGDELFGSYPSFRDVPRAVRAARLARRLPGLPGAWSKLAGTVAANRPKAAGVLRYGDSLPGAYLLRRGLFLPEELPALMGREAAAEARRQYDPLADAVSALQEPSPAGSGVALDPWLAVHQLETTRYMRNQLLRDSDWAAMASSVELRVPLVDARLRQAVARHRFEPARSRGKAVVMREVAPGLPGEVLRRRKSGFYVPVVEALQGSTQPRSHGRRSRALAAGVLRQFGVDLPVQADLNLDTDAKTRIAPMAAL